MPALMSLKLYLNFNSSLNQTKS